MLYEMPYDHFLFGVVAKYPNINLVAESFTCQKFLSLDVFPQLIQTIHYVTHVVIPL